MNRYHINWNSGMPASCSKSDCEEKHRDDPVTASREIYEVAMEKFTWKKTKWHKDAQGKHIQGNA